MNTNDKTPRLATDRTDTRDGRTTRRRIEHEGSGGARAAAAALALLVSVALAACTPPQSAADCGNIIGFNGNQVNDSIAAANNGRVSRCREAFAANELNAERAALMQRQLEMEQLERARAVNAERARRAAEEQVACMHVLEPLIRACGDGCSEQVAASLHDGWPSAVAPVSARRGRPLRERRAAHRVGRGVARPCVLTKRQATSRLRAWPQPRRFATFAGTPRPVGFASRGTRASECGATW
ncbi:MAG TPA: hypothetical protein VGM56_21370 [Byssovorax sp.]|jgi:hypothetical protein